MFLPALLSMLALLTAATAQAQPFAYISNQFSSNVSVIGGGRFCADQQLRSEPGTTGGVHHQYSVYAAGAGPTIWRTGTHHQRADESGQDSAFGYGMQMV